MDELLHPAVLDGCNLCPNPEVALSPHCQWMRPHRLNKKRSLYQHRHSGSNCAHYDWEMLCEWMDLHDVSCDQRRRTLGWWLHQQCSGAREFSSFNRDALRKLRFGSLLTWEKNTSWRGGRQISLFDWLHHSLQTSNLTAAKNFCWSWRVCLLNNKAV